MPVMLANSFWSQKVAWVASVASVATCQTITWALGSVEMGQEFKMSMSYHIWMRRTLWTSPRCWSQWSLASWMQNKKQAVNYIFAQWWLPIKINVYAGGDGLEMCWHVLICGDMWWSVLFPVTLVTSLVWASVLDAVARWCCSCTWKPLHLFPCPYLLDALAGWFCSSTCTSFLCLCLCARYLGRMIFQFCFICLTVCACLLDSLAGWFPPSKFACSGFFPNRFTCEELFHSLQINMVCCARCNGGWFAVCLLCL